MLDVLFFLFQRVADNQEILKILFNGFKAHENFQTAVPGGESDSGEIVNIRRLDGIAGKKRHFIQIVHGLQTFDHSLQRSVLSGAGFFSRPGMDD